MSSNYVDKLNDWDDFKNTLGLTEEEVDEISLKVRIVSEIVNARSGKELTQQALEELYTVLDQ